MSETVPTETPPASSASESAAKPADRKEGRWLELGAGLCGLVGLGVLSGELSQAQDAALFFGMGGLLLVLPRLTEAKVKVGETELSWKQQVEAKTKHLEERADELAKKAEAGLKLLDEKTNALTARAEEVARQADELAKKAEADKKVLTERTQVSTAAAQNLPPQIEAILARLSALEVARAPGPAPAVAANEGRERTASAAAAELRQTVDALKPGPTPDDPWKGFSNSFTERRQTATRELLCAVTPRKDGLYTIVVAVRSIDPSRPVSGPVAFLLHPTFPPHRRIVYPTDGEAVLRLVGWGAFTLGCIDDEGNRLEYDLAADERFPLDFRSR